MIQSTQGLSNQRESAFGRRCAAVLILLLSLPSLAAAETPDFNTEVLPILSNRCFTCHGPDAAAREADLRLDVREDAVPVLGSGDGSELLARVTAEDLDLRMPPAKDGQSGLSPAEVEILKRWIESGAHYDQHWSFKSIQPAADSELSAKRTRQLIDYFVARSLPDMLPSSEQAKRETLGRRASLVLTGLPLSPEELAAYRDDVSGDFEAYERLVDRLLNKPAYGQHRGRYWLDAVRYGDTHGMARDNERAIWPYRNWVVDAFNENMSFDQFTTSQIAGDLIAKDCDDKREALSHRVASAFIRCNVSTAEGGSIEDEQLYNYAADRTDTFATVWLGLTGGCARCHDHKFDPLTQREYFQLFAFFNNIDEEPMNGNALAPVPIALVPSVEQSDRLRTLEQKLDSLDTKITRLQRAFVAKKDRGRKFKTWRESRLSDFNPGWMNCRRTNGTINNLFATGNGTPWAFFGSPTTQRLQRIGRSDLKALLM